MNRVLPAFLFLLPIITLAQPSCPGVDAGPDVSICTGGSVLLKASGGFNYAWTPSQGLNDTTIYNPVANAVVTTTYHVSALVSSPNSNLFVNGDFEQGNTGFSSSYIYNANLFPTGNYNVGPDPNMYNGNFSKCTDHTTGTGNMMVLNGSTNVNANAWCQSVTITPNTDYIFSAWICKIYSTNPAQLQLTINGQVTGATFSVLTATCVWSQFTVLWNSGANTTASLCLTDLNTVGGGNDFALDDISFSPACISTDSVTVTVRPNNIVANAGPDTTICAGQAATLAASGGNIYQWSNGAGTTSIVNVSPATTTTYTVTVSSPGCSGSSDSVTVFVLTNPIPVITQSGDSLRCTVNPPGVSYQWYYNNTIIPGATDSIYVITQSGSYSVKVTNSNGCSRTVTKTATLITPTANLAVVGPTCTNKCFDFINLSINATSYKWQFPGATPTTDTAVNPTNICYHNPGTYTVVLTAYNTGTFNNKTLTVVVRAPPPVPTITQSNDTLFSSLNSAYKSYQWYYNNSLIPGATYTMLVVSQNGDYSVQVTDSNGCSQTAVRTVGLVHLVADFTSAGHICINSCIDFNNLSQNSLSYKWMFSGASPASDTSANPHNICYNSTGSYNVTLIAYNGAASDTLTFTNYITVSSPPPAPVVIQSQDTLYCSTDPSYTLYQWYYNNILVPGAIDTFLVIKQSGDYKIQVTDANGCTNTGTITAVLIIPTANFSATNNICENTCLDFTNLSLNAASYQWFFPGAYPPNDTTANPKNVCYITGGNFDVMLVVTNTGGNDTLKRTGYINVYAAPPTPIITLQGTTLYCTTDLSYTSYQWYADASLIPGATDTILVISKSGNYNVQVVDTNGCQIAVGINVILTATAQHSIHTKQSTSLNVYPNPATDELTVQTNNTSGNSIIIIYNMLGKEVAEEKLFNDPAMNINIKSLASGIYFIRLNDIENPAIQYIGRFVKE